MQLRVSPIVNGGKCLSTFHIFRWPFLFMIYDYWLRSRREQRDILQAVLNTWRQFEIAISLFQEDRLVMKDKQSVWMCVCVWHCNEGITAGAALQELPQHVSLWVFNFVHDLIEWWISQLQPELMEEHISVLSYYTVVKQTYFYKFLGHSNQYGSIMSDWRTDQGVLGSREQETCIFPSRCPWMHFREQKECRWLVIPTWISTVSIHGRQIWIHCVAPLCGKKFILIWCIL